MSRPPPRNGKTASTTKSDAASQDTNSSCNSTPAVGAAQANPPTKYSLIWAARITPATRKMVLLSLANYSNPDGTNIRPAVATVAGHCELGVSTTAEHIRQLVKSHFLRLVKPATQHWPAHYALNLGELARARQPDSGYLRKDRQPESGCLDTPDSQKTPTRQPESGYNPNDPDVSQGKEGETIPSGSSASPPTLGSGSLELPKEMEQRLFDMLVENGRKTQSRIDALVAKAHELVGQGHDVNGLAKQAIESGWVRFALPPRATAPPRPARRSTGHAGAKKAALHLGEAAGDWGMPT